MLFIMCVIFLHACNGVPRYYLPNSCQEHTKATSAVEELRRELGRSRASDSETRRQAASAAVKASNEAEAKAAARLREVEQAAAQAREKSSKELHECREACAALQRRAKAAEEKAREVVSRGSAELVELTRQRDEVCLFCTVLAMNCFKKSIHESKLIDLYGVNGPLEYVHRRFRSKVLSCDWAKKSKR